MMRQYADILEIQPWLLTGIEKREHATCRFDEGCFDEETYYANSWGVIYHADSCGAINKNCRPGFTPYRQP